MSKNKRFPVNFFRVPVQVFEFELKSSDLLVLITLCRFYPRIYPSLQKLGEMIGLSKKTVSKSIKTLTLLGLINYKKGGTGHASVYTINFAKFDNKKSNENLVTLPPTPLELYEAMTPEQREIEDKNLLDSLVYGGNKHA